MLNSNENRLRSGRALFAFLLLVNLAPLSFLTTLLLREPAMSRDAGFWMMLVVS